MNFFSYRINPLHNSQMFQTNLDSLLMVHLLLRLAHGLVVPMKMLDFCCNITNACYL